MKPRDPLYVVADLVLAPVRVVLPLAFVIAATRPQIPVILDIGASLGATWGVGFGLFIIGLNAGIAWGIWHVLGQFQGILKSLEKLDRER